MIIFIYFDFIEQTTAHRLLTDRIRYLHIDLVFDQNSSRIFFLVLHQVVYVQR